MSTFIGIDVGTSACRACAIDAHADIVAEALSDLPAPAPNGACVEQDPAVWWLALGETLDQLSTRLDTGQLQRLAIDATSATLLLCDPQGHPLTPALMYNDARAVQEAQQIARVAAPDSAALSPSSSLAKLLYLIGGLAEHHCLALHQADWLSGCLTGRFGIADDDGWIIHAGTALDGEQLVTAGGRVRLAGSLREGRLEVTEFETDGKRGRLRGSMAATPDDGAYVLRLDLEGRELYIAAPEEPESVLSERPAYDLTAQLDARGAREVRALPTRRGDHGAGGRALRYLLCLCQPAGHSAHADLPDLGDADRGRCGQQQRCHLRLFFQPG